MSGIEEAYAAAQSALGGVIGADAAATAGTVGATGAQGATLAIPAAGSGAVGAGGLSGSLATMGASLLNGLQNTFASAHGPQAGFVGPPGGTPYQNLISGLSQGATQGFFGQQVPGSTANLAGQGLGSQFSQLLMRPGQASQAEPAHPIPLRRYLPPY